MCVERADQALRRAIAPLKNKRYAVIRNRHASISVKKIRYGIADKHSRGAYSGAIHSVLSFEALFMTAYLKP